MEGLLNGALPWALAGVAVLGVLIVLRRPLRWALLLLARTALGLGALFAFGQVGGLVGISLGVNLANALVLGLLGVPGFGLLLMLNWALAV
ncbi:hypothetical protein SDC9_60071 [bioreactor metagenome]|uniref:Pro-sigmaK processing inhibitor BofA n=1 Tax=bioreactor metagenome TaxID=1076179 RepID=A0A644XBZ9_9ZZZZ